MYLDTSSQLVHGSVMKFYATVIMWICRRAFNKPSSFRRGLLTLCPPPHHHPAQRHSEQEANSQTLCVQMRRPAFCRILPHQHAADQELLGAYGISPAFGETTRSDHGFFFCGGNTRLFFNLITCLRGSRVSVATGGWLEQNGRHSTGLNGMVLVVWFDCLVD